MAAAGVCPICLTAPLDPDLASPSSPAVLNLLPCNHRVCAACAVELPPPHRPSCPVCRSLVRDVRILPEGPVVPLSTIRLASTRFTAAVLNATPQLLLLGGADIGKSRLLHLISAPFLLSPVALAAHLASTTPPDDRVLLEDLRIPCRFAPNTCVSGQPFRISAFRLPPTGTAAGHTLDAIRAYEPDFLFLACNIARLSTFCLMIDWDLRLRNVPWKPHKHTQDPPPNIAPSARQGSPASSRRGTSSQAASVLTTSRVQPSHPTSRPEMLNQWTHSAHSAREPRTDADIAPSARLRAAAHLMQHAGHPRDAYRAGRPARQSTSSATRRPGTLPSTLTPAAQAFHFGVPPRFWVFLVPPEPIEQMAANYVDFKRDVGTALEALPLDQRPATTHVFKVGETGLMTWKLRKILERALVYAAKHRPELASSCGQIGPSARAQMGGKKLSWKLEAFQVWRKRVASVFGATERQEGR